MALGNACSRSAHQPGAQRTRGVPWARVGEKKPRFPAGLVFVRNEMHGDAGASAVTLTVHAGPPNSGPERARGEASGGKVRPVRWCRELAPRAAPCASARPQSRVSAPGPAPQQGRAAQIWRSI